MKKFLAIVLGVLALTSWSWNIKAEAAKMPSVLTTTGTIVETGPEFIVVKGTGYYPLVQINLDQAKGEETFIVKNTNGKKLSAKVLKEGTPVTVYYSGMATRSYPPQTQGYAVICGKPEQSSVRYYQVAAASWSKDGQTLQLIDVDNDLSVTVTAKACKSYHHIQGGSRLLVWSDLMTMSIPALTNATRVVILQ